MKKITFGLVLTMALAGTGAAVAQQAGEVAVENFNGKFSLGYTNASDANQGSGAFGTGAIAFPLGDRYGAQLDFGSTSLDTTAGLLKRTTAIGLHLFTRDPNAYLVGVYGHVLNTSTTTGTIKNQRFGIEAALYRGEYTFQGFVGQDKITGVGAARKLEVIDLSAGRYFGDMTMATFGVTRAFDNSDVSIGVEHMYGNASAPTATFAKASFGDSGTQIRAGITIYFGSRGKSLRDIHRRNDPPVNLFSLGLGNYFAGMKANTGNPVFNL